MAAPLAASVRERSPRYAASAHAVCDALFARARLLSAPAPDVYVNLTGRFGLATKDPAWEALLQPGAAAGLGFTTDGVAKGYLPDSGCFPDDRGFSVAVNNGGKVVAEPQDSDVVRFRSAGADADGTLHSLVQTAVHSSAYEQVRPGVHVVITD